MDVFTDYLQDLFATRSADMDHRSVEQRLDNLARQVSAFEKLCAIYESHHSTQELWSKLQVITMEGAKDKGLLRMRSLNDLKESLALYLSGGDGSAPHRDYFRAFFDRVERVGALKDYFDDKIYSCLYIYFFYPSDKLTDLSSDDDDSGDRGNSNGNGKSDADDSNGGAVTRRESHATRDATTETAVEKAATAAATDQAEPIVKLGASDNGPPDDGGSDGDDDGAAQLRARLLAAGGGGGSRLRPPLRRHAWSRLSPDGACAAAARRDGDDGVALIKQKARRESKRRRLDRLRSILDAKKRSSIAAANEARSGAVERGDGSDAIKTTSSVADDDDEPTDRQRLAASVRALEELSARWSRLLTDGELDESALDADSALHGAAQLRGHARRFEALLRLVPDLLCKCARAADLARAWATSAVAAYGRRWRLGGDGDAADASPADHWRRVQHLDDSIVAVEKSARWKEGILRDKRRERRLLERRLEATRAAHELYEECSARERSLRATYEATRQERDAAARHLRSLTSGGGGVGGADDDHRSRRYWLLSEHVTELDASLAAEYGELRVLGFKLELMRQDGRLELEARPELMRLRDDAAQTIADIEETLPSDARARRDKLRQYVTLRANCSRAWRLLRRTHPDASVAQQADSSAEAAKYRSRKRQLRRLAVLADDAYDAEELAEAEALLAAAVGAAAAGGDGAAEPRRVVAPTAPRSNSADGSSGIVVVDSPRPSSSSSSSAHRRRNVDPPAVGDDRSDNDDDEDGDDDGNDNSDHVDVDPTFFPAAAMLLNEEKERAARRKQERMAAAMAVGRAEEAALLSISHGGGERAASRARRSSSVRISERGSARSSNRDREAGDAAELHASPSVSPGARDASHTKTPRERQRKQLLLRAADAGDEASSPEALTLGAQRGASSGGKTVYILKRSRSSSDRVGAAPLPGAEAAAAAASEPVAEAGVSPPQRDNDGAKSPSAKEPTIIFQQKIASRERPGRRLAALAAPALLQPLPHRLEASKRTAIDDERTEVSEGGALPPPPQALASNRSQGRRRDGGGGRSEYRSVLSGIDAEPPAPERDDAEVMAASRNPRGGLGGRPVAPSTEQTRLPKKAIATAAAVGDVANVDGGIAAPQQADRRRRGETEARARHAVVVASVGRDVGARRVSRPERVEIVRPPVPHYFVESSDDSEQEIFKQRRLAQQQPQPRDVVVGARRKR